MNVSAAQQLERAKERFGLQDYHGAALLLDELIQSGKAFADAHHLAGLSYELMEQPDRALEAFDQALVLNPRYVEAHIHRGIVLAGLGRDEEAAEAFGAARESGGSERPGGIPAHHAAKLANQHAELGDAYAEAGALSAAIDQYRRALELGPAFHDLRYRLARFLLDAGRTLEAREELETILSARPGSAEARSALGLACYLAGDAASARGHWQRILEERPDDARARAYLSMLERASGA